MAAVLLGLFATLTLAKPDTGAAAVFVDEFDASRFQCLPNGQVICSCHCRIQFSELSAPNCPKAHRRLARKIFSTPPQERSGRSDLIAGQRALTHIVSYGIISAIPDFK